VRGEKKKEGEGGARVVQGFISSKKLKWGGCGDRGGLGAKRTEINVNAGGKCDIKENDRHFLTFTRNAEGDDPSGKKSLSMKETRGGEGKHLAHTGAGGK